MFTFIVTWHTEDGFRTAEYANFLAADSWAAAISVHFGTATIVCKELKGIYHEYQNGVKIR